MSYLPINNGFLLIGINNINKPYSSPYSEVTHIVFYIVNLKIQKLIQNIQNSNYTCSAPALFISAPALFVSVPTLLLAFTAPTTGLLI